MMELNGRPAGVEELGALALYNYGHFTTMRVEDGRVRGLSLHLERLLGDCRVLHGADLDLDRVRHLVRRVATPGTPLIVRVTVFDPGLDLARPAVKAHPEILVSTRPVPGDLPPLVLGTTEYQRDLPEVKHSGLFGPVLHRRFALAGGYDDALFTDARGRVTEGPTWNIGFVRDGRVLWPENDRLPGVTMRLLQRVADRAGVPSAMAAVDLGDLPGMTAAFVTNSAIGVRPVRSIDGAELRPDEPIMTTLRREYAALPGEPL
ncbi:aminotransferase class IV family protein [Sphaerisporangium sp. NPDC051017]|uniref:aminotransferase class IV family protein n=1 Tax=Sphaerisporangium sp. NPDC051017 TaxID=3154636 RepID=UPI00342312A6